MCCRCHAEGHNRLVRPVPIICAAVLALAAAGAAAATPAPAKPRLALSGLQPAAVRGSHFAGRERVRVGFSAGGETWIRTVRTTEAGTFVAPAPEDFTYSPCGSPLLVTALGARGDRATLRLAQRECPSP
jgi:hypothetical protein